MLAGPMNDIARLRLHNQHIAGRARRVPEQAGLDEAIFARSRKLFIRALRGGKQLPRQSMYQLLEANISTAESRGLHILGRLVQDGLICFGARDKSSTAYLLPAYDEHTVGYRDRSAVFNPAYAQQHGQGYAIFNPTVVVDGQVVGVLKRESDKARSS